MHLLLSFQYHRSSLHTPILRRRWMEAATKTQKKWVYTKWRWKTNNKHNQKMNIKLIMMIIKSIKPFDRRMKWKVFFSMQTVHPVIISTPIAFHTINFYNQHFLLRAGWKLVNNESNCHKQERERDLEIEAYLVRGLYFFFASLLLFTRSAVSKRKSQSARWLWFPFLCPCVEWHCAYCLRVGLSTNKADKNKRENKSKQRKRFKEYFYGSANAVTYVLWTEVQPQRKK